MKKAITDIAYQQGWIIENKSPLTLSYHKDSNMEFSLEIERYYQQVGEKNLLKQKQFDELHAKLNKTAINADADIYNQNLMDMVQTIEDMEVEDIENDDAPAIQYINRIIQGAMQQKASDIHIEVFEERLNIRYRLDGILQDILSTPSRVSHLLLARIKIMAQLDVSEKRLPQDGRLSFEYNGEQIDVRVSTLPTQKSERIVLRILKKEVQDLYVENLGMNKTAQTAYKQSLAHNNGMVLVSGPTGAGKTTTLYAGVQSINNSDINIMTVEDPIEYNLEGVNQTQVNTNIDMTFERGLRAILRQDPDVILIGEIRDDVTANIAVQSSLTGHLVLSTLHANDAVSTLTRLLNIGVEPHYIASTLKVIIAQRLVRKLCKCKKKVSADVVAQKLLGCKKDQKIYEANGCEECNNIGYKGRLGVFEIATNDENLSKALMEGVPEKQLAKSIKYITTLSEDAKKKILDGETTVSEYFRVLG